MVFFRDKKNLRFAVQVLAAMVGSDRKSCGAVNGVADKLTVEVELMSDHGGEDRRAVSVSVTLE